jgi:quercetin dioxygenase-like cupin family protein
MDDWTKMFSIRGIFSILSISLLINASCIVAKSLEVERSPTTSRPFVLRNLDGQQVQLADDVFRVLVSPNASGVFSLLGTNGQGSPTRVPAHLHLKYYETFYVVKGAILLWIGGEARRLGPGDFGAVPSDTVHSYQITEPDTQITGFIFDGPNAGFEKFFLNISTPYSSVTNAPFPPDQPLAFPIQQFLAVAASYDVELSQAPLNDNLINGTTGGVWHTGNNTLPTNAHTSYFIANNWGPKYFYKPLGQVVATLATSVTSGGNFTISTIVMRRSQNSDKIQVLEFPSAQAFQVLEGVLLLDITGYGKVTLNTGDVVHLPAGTRFWYYSSVAYTKFYVGTAGKGLDSWLLSQKETIPWDYAVFAAYK